MSANAEVHELIDVAGRLSAVMAREAELLRAARVRDIEPLQSEKSALTASYAGAVESLRRNPALVRRAEPGLRAALEAAVEDLRTKLEANARALRAAKDVNERLIHALGDALVELNGAGKSYTPSGGAAAGAARAPGLAVAVDHRI